MPVTPVQEFQKLFSDFLNRGDSSDFKEFAQCVQCDHRTLQQSAFSLFMECLHVWAEAYDNGLYDARNEFTCKKAKEIVTTIEGMEFKRAPFI